MDVPRDESMGRAPTLLDGVGNSAASDCCCDYDDTLRPQYPPYLSSNLLKTLSTWAVFFSRSVLHIYSTSMC